MELHTQIKGPRMNNADLGIQFPKDFVSLGGLVAPQDPALRKIIERRLETIPKMTPDGHLDRNSSQNTQWRRLWRHPRGAF